MSSKIRSEATSTFMTCAFNTAWEEHPRTEHTHVARTVQAVIQLPCACAGSSGITPQAGAQVP